MIVVDTSVWIDHFRNADVDHVRRLRTIRDPAAILVGDVVILEVLRGARDDAHAARFKRAFQGFARASFLDAELAEKAAAYFRFMRTKGVTIRKAVDLIIGTYCLVHGHELLHNDRDFDAMTKHLNVRTYQSS